MSEKMKDSPWGRIARMLSVPALATVLALSGAALAYADSVGSPKGASTSVITRNNSKNQAEAQAKFTYVNVVYQSTGTVGYYNKANGWIRDRMPTDGQQVYGTHFGRREVMQSTFYPGGTRRDVATWVAAGTVQTARTSKNSEVAVSANVFHFKNLPKGLTGRWSSGLSVCVDVRLAPDACASAPTITFSGIWRTA
jgi:hypothetical protein